MTVDELHAEMNGKFAGVDGRFEAVDARFEAVDARFDAVDARFDAVDARFDAVDARFDAVDTRFGAIDGQLGEVRAEIKAEGIETRRHFDVVAEQLRDYVKVLADGIARNTERLDQHDTRLDTLERARNSR